MVTISMEGFPPRHDFFDLWDKTKDRLKGTCLRIIPKTKLFFRLKNLSANTHRSRRFDNDGKGFEIFLDYF